MHFSLLKKKEHLQLKVWTLETISSSPALSWAEALAAYLDVPGALGRAPQCRGGGAGSLVPPFSLGRHRLTSPLPVLSCQLLLAPSSIFWAGAKAARQCSSVQHGIQLVGQGIEHGADVIQDVLGGGASRAFSLLSADALLSGPQGSSQGGAGLLQPLLGPAWAWWPHALGPWWGHWAGAGPGCQFRTREGQLCAGYGYRYGLGGCPCRDKAGP